MKRSLNMVLAGFAGAVQVVGSLPLKADSYYKVKDEPNGATKKVTIKIPELNS